MFGGENLWLLNNFIDLKSQRDVYNKERIRNSTSFYGDINTVAILSLASRVVSSTHFEIFH